MKNLKTFLCALFCIFLHVGSAASYPLDGFDETDIPRLDGYFHSLLTDDGVKNLSAGSLLSITEIELSKPKINYFADDANLKRQLMSIVPPGVSISLLDISNSSHPRYAGINDSSSFTPGSIGKVMVAVSLFDALKRIYPTSIEKRQKILRERQIVADDFILTDEHVVPFWDAENRKIYFRPLQIGDSASIWTYLDWMLSASSNAAASLIMREVLLMNHFKQRYPPSTREAEAFLHSSAAPASLRESFISPIARQGLNAGRLFQASFFTKSAKKLIGGAGSAATTKDLVQLLLFIEQGRVVDEFSSLELKRLLYLTQHRERYVGTHVLDSSAVYFKAGSLAKCSGHCEKYEGNLQNMLNALVIVEYPLGKPTRRYLLAMSSNVLKRNAEDLHKSIAVRINALFR